MKNKMKAWRRQACPRTEDGRKIKYSNRRAKNADMASRGIPVMPHPLLMALLERAGARRTQ